MGGTMSQSLSYVSCDVVITFKDSKDMDSRIKAFEKEVSEYDNKCRENDYENDPVCARVVMSPINNLSARVVVDSDGETWIDESKLAELICKHFYSAEGIIGYAIVGLRGGYCSDAAGGQIIIKDGKILPSDRKQVEELKEDLDKALEYISMVISNGDITECGVAHLFKKYYPEDYKEELKNKEE